MNENELAAVSGIENILSGKPADAETAPVVQAEAPVAPAAKPVVKDEAAKPVEKPTEKVAESETPEQPVKAETPKDVTPVEGEPVADEATEITEEVPALDWTQFLPTVQAPEPDEDGNVDISQLVQHQVSEAVRQASAEQQAWAMAQKEMPEIATNQALREFVLNQRIADVANGGDGDIMKATRAIKAVLGGARAEGKAQAQSSVTVQKAAALEDGSGTSPDVMQAAPHADLMAKIEAGDRDAGEALIAAWIDEGLI